MIEIKKKEDCCGCSACVQKCPKSCISMKEDSEGFLYPHVNINDCINCGLCEKVCPIINKRESRKPKAVYAAKHKDDQIRLSSSSGGIFTALAESVIDDGGVVFGAKFNESWSVVHDYTETKEGLSAFRGSKYVQSQIGDSFKKAEAFLKSGRKVLFSGTPCQIAGLKCYLRKEYENLLTVDFICHGVPSSGVWREYLKEETALLCGGKNSVLSHPNINKKNVHIESISFRDKRIGWKKFSFALTLSVPDGHGEKNTVLLSETKYQNLFLKGFLRDLFLRPSCHHCKVKGFSSGSDITIADFWAINHFLPNENDHCGYSLCMFHSDVRLKCKMFELDANNVCKTNVTIYHSSLAHKNRKVFFQKFSSGEKVIPLIRKYATVSFKRKVFLIIASLLKN